MASNRKHLDFILIFLVCLMSTMDLTAQDYMKTRKVSINRGDTSVVACILADLQVEKVDPGIFYYWYGHEQINGNQGGYSGHLLHGEYLEYGSSGKLLLKGTFDKGRRTGRWIYWYKAGSIKETREYVGGILEGSIIRYNQDGRIIHSAEYRHNQLHGEMTTVLSDTVYQIKYKKGVEKKRVPLHVFEE